MNIGLVAIYFIGALIITCISSKNVKGIRKIVLIITGLAFTASFFGSFKPLQLNAGMILRCGLKPVETGILIMLCGSFFLSLLARGKASKSELLSSLALFGIGTFGIYTVNLNYFIIGLVVLFLLVGTMLKFSKIRIPKEGRKAVFTASLLCLGLGFSGIALRGNAQFRSCSETLLSFSFVCLLCAFPIHFWLPKFLSQSPFGLAIFIPVLFPRLALVGYAHFLPKAVEVGIGNSSLGAFLSVLGLVGALWCGLAGFSSQNLAEKFGYFVTVQSGLALWAVGKGMLDEALFFLFAVTPATVLFGIIVSILFARIKSFNIEYIEGRCAFLFRLKLFLALSLLGMSFFPGSMNFVSLVVLLGGKAATWEVFCITGSVLLLFFAGADLFIRLCFKKQEIKTLGIGDLNPRENRAVIPLGICLLAGLWPGLTNLLRELF